MATLYHAYISVSRNIEEEFVTFLLHDYGVTQLFSINQSLPFSLSFSFILVYLLLDYGGNATWLVHLSYFDLDSLLMAFELSYLFSCAVLHNCC